MPATAIPIKSHRKRLKLPAAAVVTDLGCTTATSVCCPTGGDGGYSPDCARNISSVLYASLPFGDGTMTLTWDGATYWVGSKLLACGKTLYLRFRIDPAFNPGAPNILEFSCNGTTYGSSAGRPTLDCIPSFIAGDDTFDLNQAAFGCGAPCSVAYGPITISE